MTDEPDEIEVEEVEVEEVETPEPVKREWTDDDATEARALGWKAPDEWTGDKPAGYIDDPRRFVNRAEHKAQTERNANFDDRVRKIEAMNERAIVAQREQYERDIAAISKAQRSAAEIADVQRYDALERQKTTMRPPVEPRQAPPELAEVTAYKAANEWIRDPTFYAEARQAIDHAMQSGRQFQNASEQIQYAESVMKRKYPDIFRPPAQEVRAAPPSRVDGGGLGVGSSGVSAYSKMPGEAKAAFMKFVGQGIFANTPADQKRYADDYNAA